MSSDLVVRAESLGKTYRLFKHPGDRIRQALAFGLRNYHTTYDAVRNVTFEIHRGEVVGIVGRNGSGKSTLLQLVCGILRPTSGKIQLDGDVSALLELGSGFNPEFTGRENLYFQGMLFGLKESEMVSKIDDIVCFSGVGEHLDQPVRTYSSGMFLRLAFAVSVAVNPSLLVVDEALAVGDARFQSRCFKKIQTLRDNGSAVLFVSHSMEQITRFCDRALLMESGELVEQGSPKTVVNRYLASAFSNETGPGQKTARDPSSDPFSSRQGFNKSEYRFGNGAAEIFDFQFFNSSFEEIAPRFTANTCVTLRFSVAFHRSSQNTTFAISLSTLDGLTLFSVNSRDIPFSPSTATFDKGSRVHASFKLRMHLAAAEYLLSFSVSEEIGGALIPLDRRYDSVFVSIVGGHQQRGVVDLQPTFELTL
jgi:lipopolysaccharide transport system ATP-binding protein